MRKLTSSTLVVFAIAGACSLDDVPDGTEEVAAAAAAEDADDVAARLAAERDEVEASLLMTALGRVGGAGVVAQLEAEVAARHPMRTPSALAAIHSIGKRTGDAALTARAAALLEQALRAPGEVEPAHLLLLAPELTGTLLVDFLDQVLAGDYPPAVRARAQELADQIIDRGGPELPGCGQPFAAEVMP